VLDTAREIGGKLPALNYADRLKRILEKGWLAQRWDQKRAPVILLPATTTRSIRTKMNCGLDGELAPNVFSTTANWFAEASGKFFAISCPQPMRSNVQ